jgi:hypothetical protein
MKPFLEALIGILLGFALLIFLMFFAVGVVEWIIN